MTSSGPHHSVPPDLQQPSPARQRRRLPPFNAAAYVSFDQAASGYALVGVCASIGRKRATISDASVAFTGVGEIAFLAGSFGQLVETKGDMATVEKAAREALEGIEIGGDVHAPAEFRRHLGVVAASARCRLRTNGRGRRAFLVPRSAFLV